MWFTISVGATAASGKITHKEIEWEDFLKRLSKPIRTGETVSQYTRMPKEQALKIKDVGYFIFGEHEGQIRGNKHLKNRSGLVLDIDHLDPESFNRIINKLNECGWTYALYSTHSHTEDHPRARVILPTDRVMQPAEYEPAGRKLAENLGFLDHCDYTGFQPARIMYWPSVSVDGEYIFKYGAGELVSVDGLLDDYIDWEGPVEWPRTAREKALKIRFSTHPLKEKQENPKSKPGVIGAFCKTFSVYDVLDMFIPGTYLPGTIPGRYTYKNSSSSNGAVVYDEGLFLFSHHESDPGFNRLLNAFDLLCVHRYPDVPVQQVIKKVGQLSMVKENLTPDQDAVRDFEKMDLPVAPKIVISEGSEKKPREDVLAELLEKYVFVREQDVFLNLDNGSAIRPGALERAYGHTVGKRRSIGTELAKAGIRQVDNLTWNPGQPEVIRCSRGKSLINTYKPPSIIPEPGSVQPWMHLLHYLIPDEGQRNHLLDWMAWNAQNPGLKCNHQIIMGGRMGVGKDSIFQPLIAAFGEHNVSQPQADSLLSSFNEWLDKVRLVIVQELRNFSRSSLENSLKPYAAAPPATIRINSKGLKTFEIKNVLSMVMLTNYKDAIALHTDDRRYFCIWSDMDPLSEAFYINYYAWLEREGLPYCVYFLLHRDVSHFNPGAAPPKTVFRQSLIETGLPEYIQDLRILINDRIGVFKNDIVSVQEIQAEMTAAGCRRNTLVAVGRAMERLQGAGLACFKTRATGLGEDGTVEKRTLWTVRNINKYKGLSGADIYRVWSRTVSTLH